MPTPIQVQAIPIVLSGRDLLGIAQTGTGKTAAFMLPSIDRLVAAAKRPVGGRCRMLVLAPTRELASQIAQSAIDYARGSRLHVVTVFGGTSIYKNKQDMARGADILVATPGRLVDLVEQRAISLDAVEILVLDEADQMLDLGFIHALKWVVARLPAVRQTLFFSATMPSAIRELADRFLKDPVQVSVTPSATTVERIAQSMSFVDQKEKGYLLTLFLKREPIERALVFSRTKHGADKIVRQLAASGIVANAIHGNKSQPQRERALADFKSGRVKVLIATDIAARGIDVTGVSHVINYDLPNVFEQYVHRIGRTARAGAEGIAFSMCADDERAYIRGIEKLTRQKIEVRPLPSDFGAEAARMRALRPAPEPERGERPPQRSGRPRHDSQPRRDSEPRRDSAPRRDGQAPRRDGLAPRREALPHGQRNAAPRPAHTGAARPAHVGAARPHGAARPQGSGRPAGGGGPRGPQRDNRGGRPSGQRTSY